MKKKPKSTRTATDALKAYKAARRQEEIELHGKPLKQGGVVKSKKRYTRERKHKGETGREIEV